MATSPRCTGRAAPAFRRFCGRQLLPYGISTSRLMLIIAATCICSRRRASPVCLALLIRGTAKASEQIHGVSRERRVMPPAVAGQGWLVTISSSGCKGHRGAKASWERLHKLHPRFHESPNWGHFNGTSVHFRDLLRFLIHSL